MRSHWEALHDPDQERPLSVDRPIVRKNQRPVYLPRRGETRPSTAGSTGDRATGAVAGM